MAALSNDMAEMSVAEGAAAAAAEESSTVAAAADTGADTGADTTQSKKPPGQEGGVQDGRTWRMCTEADLSAWAAAAGGQETLATGWGEADSKDFKWSGGKDWFDSYESVKLHVDGTCSRRVSGNSGRDSSCSSWYTGAWSVNEHGLVECWHFKYRGHSGSTDFPSPQRGDNVEQRVTPSWFKIEGATLVQMKKNSLEPEHECKFSAPYLDAERAVLC
jgi:hypothetical protein